MSGEMGYLVCFVLWFVWLDEWGVSDNDEINQTIFEG
jgi:hypothetical protein